jgi:hypothetical protein
MSGSAVRRPSRGSAIEKGGIHSSSWERNASEPGGSEHQGEKATPRPVAESHDDPSRQVGRLKKKYD